MRLPPCRVVNRANGSYRILTPFGVVRDGGFPAVLKFPKLTVTTLQNAYCLPFAPPMLPAQRNIISDYLVPWSPSIAPWFDHAGGNVYRVNINVRPEDVRYDIDIGFYMDHPISEHFGHFVGDCLCRMYAWDIVRQIYGDVKLILADRARPAFQDDLLAAAGVAEQDVVKINTLARCKRLLLATPSLGVEQYATPTASRLWGTIRDRGARRDISLPSRVYFSRTGVAARPLLNETVVEGIFERQGFTIVHPELLTVAQQMALAANALLIAGPSGSAMFNLAFQGRLRSAFILAREEGLQLTEMLFCAGGSSDLWYHAGKDAHHAIVPSDAKPWLVNPLELESNVADWVSASDG
jgi:capsular polysaccharide biosynthesis protein